MIKTLLFSLSILLSLSSTLIAALSDKSAMIYYGKNISYPMIGIHDYVIVQPELTNTNTHGFSIYKEKMYAYVSIGEIDKKIKEYKNIKPEWIIAKNEAWSSEVLDIKNREYQEYLFEEMIEPRMREGFKNFFFDTLDSYQLACKTQEERVANEKELINFINLFHKKYPDSKLIVNRGFEIIDQIHQSLEAVLFESYYVGIGGEKLAYKRVSDEDREWLDVHLNKIKSHGVNIISVEYLDASKIDQDNEIIKNIQAKGMIPYLSNRELTLYGKSSKNAIKREIFTLIDERRLDRTLMEAHQHGALILEYMGYVQKLHDINKGLPNIEDMRHYSGVVIWLQDHYEQPRKLVKWVKELSLIGVKVAFVNNFGFKVSSDLLAPLDISVKHVSKTKARVLHQDEMMGYEIDVSMSLSNMEIKSKNVKPLLVYEHMDGTQSTLAAITSWGGYAIDESFMFDINKENIWVINPFKFFSEALGLQPLIVPDSSTENGKRLLFTHVDGDGIMNRVEGNSELFSGDIILEKILKVYKIPHSVSVIGGEIDPNGLYPKLSKKLISIAQDMYKLDNVEAATHTFTHPFYWGKIVNNALSKEYRLKVKDYNFTIQRELLGSINDINARLIPPEKPLAKTIFWTGDCTPRENALEHIYKNKLLNINGGDTLITKTKPWLSYVGPLGVERSEYYQIYTGAQNENVYTNDWLGPFWGFKKVVQTFKMTNSPRRLKPIDIYYHLYSGSKMASLKALEYVFDWSIAQDVMPIFTSQYIPKVMDYYTVSMANENREWLVEGMRDLKTIRIEKENASVDLNRSKSTLGVKHFETHTYVSLNGSTKHYIVSAEGDMSKDDSYLISSNAKVTEYKNMSNEKRFSFDGHVDLKLNFYVPLSCKVFSLPKATKVHASGNDVKFEYAGVKKANVKIVCDY